MINSMIVNKFEFIFLFIINFDKKDLFLKYSKIISFYIRNNQIMVIKLQIKIILIKSHWFK